MAVYTVHQPPLRATDAAPDPQRFVFVRDGFYFWAFHSRVALDGYGTGCGWCC